MHILIDATITTQCGHDSCKLELLVITLQSMLTYANLQEHEKIKGCIEAEAQGIYVKLEVI